MQLKSVRRCGAASTGPTNVRSWDDLNYDLLVNIIKRVTWPARLFVVCLVNKSWLSAVLDSMSTPGVINLEALDLPEVERVKFRYCRFLKRMIDSKPIDSWSAFILGNTPLKGGKYLYIAKKTPSLQQLFIPCTMGMGFANIGYAFKYWKKMKQVSCPVWLIKVYPNCFTMVENLRLFGVVDDAAAIAIRDNCPRLKQLNLNSCAFSIKALSIILDGHKQLELLDTRHGYRVANCEKLARDGFSIPLEWNEEEIRHKAAGIKEYLMCDRCCVECAAATRRNHRRCFPKPPRRYEDPQLCYGI
ncbi:hypothetical protein RDABS01_015741 [Bienertia sinuspersici]